MATPPGDFRRNLSVTATVLAETQHPRAAAAATRLVETADRTDAAYAAALRTCDEAIAVANSSAATSADVAAARARMRAASAVYDLEASQAEAAGRRYRSAVSGVNRETALVEAGVALGPVVAGARAVAAVAGEVGAFVPLPFAGPVAMAAGAVVGAIGSVGAGREALREFRGQQAGALARHREEAGARYDEREQQAAEARARHGEEADAREATNETE